MPSLNHYLCPQKVFMLKIPALITSLLLFFMPALAQSEVKENTPGEESQIICKAGFYVKTIKINQTDENFDVLLYYWLRVDSIEIGKDYSGIKDIEFVNADTEIGEPDYEHTDTAGRYYFVSGKCKATIPYKADLTRFPFDILKLKISLENTVSNQSTIRYIPDSQFLAPNFKQDNIEILNGDLFSLQETKVLENSYTYTTNFGDPQIKGFEKYSRLDFVISLKRNPRGIMEKITLPLIVVLILSYLVFFIPDYEIGTSSGLTVTALLAAIAFQWTINDSLPKVSYPTVIDKIFYLIYTYVFYAMAQTVVTFNLAQSENEKLKVLSGKIEWHSRYAFPLSFVFFLLLLIF